MISRRQLMSSLGVGAGIGSSAIGLAPLAAQSQSPRTKLVGLSIGINQYQHLTSLRTAEQDAISISERLSQVGYDMVAPPTAPTTDGILDSFTQFISQVDSNSAAFLFLAGHGVQVEGRNYLLPSNVKELGHVDALIDALPLDDFLDSISKARPRQMIIMLDACRDDSLGRDLPGFSRGIASTNAPRDCYITYSAGRGEFALDSLADDDASPNGLFTRHLLDHLAGEKTIHDIVSSTKAPVIADAEAIGHQQHPAIYDQTRRPYFLDGIERRDGGGLEDSAGSLARTGIVLAAAQEYSCLGMPLASTKSDAVRLHRTLDGLGAEVVTLINPSRSSVIEACENLGGQDFDQYAFMWLGRGALRDVQAAALIDTGNCLSGGAEKASGEGNVGIQAVTHSDIISAFRSENASQESGGKDQSKASGSTGSAGPPKPLTLFFDSGLARDDALSISGEFDTSVRLNDLPDEFMLDSKFHDVAMISATSAGQPKPASAARAGASPFVTALINGLGRPGLTLNGLWELVKDEVEALSDGEQSPQLIAPRKSEGRVFVSRLSREQQQARRNARSKAHRA